MNVLVTGAGGYIGTMLLDALGEQSAVEKLVGVDLKPLPPRQACNAKLRWIQADVADETWSEVARREGVSVVLHCAYQIRQLYGADGKAAQQRWNIEGARRVFEFALSEPSVHRLIQFSTISAYGATPDNSLTIPFTEESALAEETYLYGVQKRQIETLLRNLYATSSGSTDVIIVRLASVTGPRGRFGLERYGLVSTLAGRFPFVPFGRLDWCRQYLHEDDLTEIITLLVQAPTQGGSLDVFNVAPPDYLVACDFARILGKQAVPVPAWLLRGLFKLLWHGTRGAVGTPGGGWRFLSYPIRADGSCLTRKLDYTYRYSSAEALLARRGRYAATEAVPEAIEKTGEATG